MTYDAVIIGAGLSGLCAGIRLAMFDKRVCILEQHGRAGGLNSFYERGERRFDVGLHALTHYTQKGVRNSALGRILRQLRMRHADFELEPQWGSRIHFPSCSLRFTNDFETFRAEVADRFPNEIDNLDRMVADMADYDETATDAAMTSAREMLSRYIHEPLLREMLLCPVMFYGSASEHDIPWPSFVLLWKGFFHSGLARPRCGMRGIIDKLLHRYEEAGGELRYGARVGSLDVQNDHVKSVTLASGETITAAQIYSSAGHVETARLLSDTPDNALAEDAGRVSLIEYLACLDCMPRDLGHEDTVVFYSKTDEFPFRRPDELAESQAGVIAASNNFGSGDHLPEGRVRVSHLASYPAWRDVLGAARPSEASADGKARYRDAKKSLEPVCIADAEAYMPGLGQHVTFSDMFTPMTLVRYTGHVEGCLYGSHVKRRDGATRCDNLILIGADEGFFGIVGAMLSGIIMANAWGLKGN